MNSLIALSALLLLGAVSAKPFDGHTILNLTDSFFRDSNIIYTSKSKLTKIVVPININQGDDFNKYFVFFINADGVSVIHNGEVSQVLAKGTDVAGSAKDGNNNVFIGASDGIYTFNTETKTAEKYGTLTDDVKEVAYTNGTNELYVLSAGNVYKVTDEGTKKEKVEGIEDAVRIDLDYQNNLYYFDSKNNLYVRSHEDGSVKKIELPTVEHFVYFFRPPVVLTDRVPFLIDNDSYTVGVDGRAEFSGLVFNPEITAYAPETASVLYIGYKNKIYKYTVSDINNLEKEHDESA